MNRGPDDESFRLAVETERATIERLSAHYTDSDPRERIAARSRGMQAVRTFVAFVEATAGEDAGEVDRGVYADLVDFMALVGQDMARDALQLPAEVCRERQ